MHVPGSHEAVLSVFPETDAVFAEPVGPAKRCLLPLVSIDLSVVNPVWSGVAHLVSPVEPEEGYVGDETEEFHTATCRVNWIGFGLDDDNRYRLLADWRYFAGSDPDADTNPGLAKFYEEVHASYERKKSLYAEHGKLLETRWMDRQPLPDVLANPLDIVETVGGAASGWWNWMGNESLPLNTDDPDDVYPLAAGGARFYHVATTIGWYWREDGADRIVMFYEPVSRTVLFTFDWS